MVYGIQRADLVVLGDVKGIMRDLQVLDRFDVDAKLAMIPVNLDSTVQVTVKRLRWPIEHPSFLTFEIYDSKGKLVHSKLVHEPIKRGFDELVRPSVVDTFYSVDWIPSKAGKYTIKATLTDSLTEPRISTHLVKTVRVVNR